MHFEDFSRPLLHPSEYFFPPGIPWPVGAATSLSSQGHVPGACPLPSWPRQEAKENFQRKRKPVGAGKTVRLSLQPQRVVPWPSRTQPGPRYSAFPASRSGQVAMVFCLLVQWDWGEKSRGGSEPEDGDLREGFKTWRRAGLSAPAPAGS